MRTPNISISVIDQLVVAYNSGKTLQQLKEEFALPRQTIHYWLQKRNVKLRPRGRVPDLGKEAFIARASLNGLGIRAIAETYQLKEGQVKRALKRHGVERSNSRQMLPTEVENAIVKAYRNPDTNVGKFAEAYGIHRRTVVRLVRRHGVTIRPSNGSKLKL